MSHLMIDIETLGLKPNAVIVSVALVSFDPTRGDEIPVTLVMNDNLDVVTQLRECASIDASTVAWWMEQPYHARQRAFCPQISIVREDAIQKINEAVAAHDTLWANGPDFDCVKLQNYTGNNKWPFWKHRCVRTFKSQFNEPLIDFQPTTQHDPLQDCMDQIKQVAKIYAWLRTKGVNMP